MSFVYRPIHSYTMFYTLKLHEQDTYRASDYLRKYNEEFPDSKLNTIDLFTHVETNRYFYVIQEASRVYLYKKLSYFVKDGKLHYIEEDYQFDEF